MLPDMKKFPPTVASAVLFRLAKLLNVDIIAMTRGGEAGGVVLDYHRNLHKSVFYLLRIQRMPPWNFSRSDIFIVIVRDMQFRVPIQLNRRTH
jgi:hypothetical protein